MSTKYEVIQIDQAEITVDVSMLTKTEEMFFNATQMAKPFGKVVRDFLRLESTKEYMDEIFKVENSPLKNYDDLVKMKKGRYGGTFLHNELAFEFAGWCSAIFRRNLHKWAEDRLKKETEWRNNRLEAKTGYLPMTEAILNNHDPAKFYHFTTEADMINRIVLGVSAKKFREENEVDRVRDACTAAQLHELKQMQEFNTTLIKLGMGYHSRKETLVRFHNGEIGFLGAVA
jgi:hypothetical protein